MLLLLPVPFPNHGNIVGDHRDQESDHSPTSRPEIVYRKGAAVGLASKNQLLDATKRGERRPGSDDRCRCANDSQLFEL